MKTKPANIYYIQNDCWTAGHPHIEVEQTVPYVRQVATVLDGHRKMRKGVQKAKAPNPIPMAARLAKWQKAVSQTAFQPIRETPSIVYKCNAKGIRYF